MREPLDAGRVFAPEQRTVPLMLRQRAQQFGARPLVQAGETAWTFNYAATTPDPYQLPGNTGENPATTGRLTSVSRLTPQGPTLRSRWR